MNGMFNGCESLTKLDLSSFDTASATDMAYMFRDCKSLSALTLSENFKGEKAKNMSYMFSGCSALTSLDIRNITFDKTTSYTDMLSGISSTTTIYVSQKGATFINEKIEQGYNLVTV